MNLSDFAPVAALLDASYAALHGLAVLLDPVAGGAASALAIVLVTLLVRAALIPLGRLQVRAELTRRRLAPKLRELQRRYKNRPEQLQQKTLALYRDEKASPFAGILPALAQAPVLSLLYGVFTLVTINGHPNALLTDTLGGVPLGTSFAALVGQGAWADAAVAGLLLVAIAVTAFFSRRQAIRFAEPPVAGDAASEQQFRLVRIMSSLSFLTVVFAAIVPLAATVYLTITTLWTLLEREALRRRMGVLPGGGLAPAAAG
jgi:YidC/Oxa1 family membrane protein insertase